jgi:FkbM family methyltransferase
LIKRVKAAHQRLNCASIFTGSYLRSAAHFTAFKLNKKATVRGRLGGIPFYFRSADVEALKEVLVDREYSFLGELLRLHEAPKILDIGHHIGTFSLWAFCQNPKARILGVEADPDTVAVAEKNARLGRANGLDWRVIHRAAWGDDKPVSFSGRGDTMGHQVAQAGELKVQGASFQTLIQQAGGRVHLIKLDVEGADETFLAAAPALLQRTESLVIEIHPKCCSEKNVLQILQEHIDRIMPVQCRGTSKPLLWCTRTRG